MVSRLSLQHQVLICRTYALQQLRRFWTTFQTEFANERSYKASIGSMRLRLQKLQDADSKAQELRQQKANGYEKTNEILRHQGLSFVLNAISTELISRHHNNPLASHFGIEKTCKLLFWKYYRPTLCHNVKAYVKGYDVCLASKAVRHKPCADLQLLLIPMTQWKDFLMNFVTSLPISINWKEDNYDFILVIVNWFTKMVHYKPVKIIINAPGLAKVIIDVIMPYHGLPDSIVTNWGSLFTSKFWSSLCYFLGIKHRLSNTFHSQTDSQTKKQNSIIEAYIQAFINFEQNNWAKLLTIAEFAYNNAKNASTGHTSFELNYGYHPYVSFEEDIDPCYQSKTVDKLSTELQELMTVCWKNLYYAQKLQKQANNKGVKLKSYAPNDKICLNSKYIKIKWNQKLEAKFFRPFQVLHPVDKQA